MPRPSSDGGDEVDTAFGGLAPRSGPEAEPVARKPGRWGLVVGAVLVLGLVVAIVFQLVAR
jgi:hypothetical protein